MTTEIAQIEPLAWDSEAFGFGVGRTQCAVLGEKELTSWSQSARGVGVRLLYARTPSAASAEVLERAVQSGQLQGYFAEQRMRFARRWDHSFLPSERFAEVLRPGGSLPLRAPASAATQAEVRLEAYPPGPADPALHELALLAGGLSRFRLDPLFPKELFEMLYATWIARSTRHEIADKVIVAVADGQPVGFVSVATRAALASIGLAAVSEAWRGRSVARALMSAAETVARAAGHQALEVVTQGANTAAKKLYERSGYALEHSEWMYHLWF